MSIYKGQTLILKSNEQYAFEFVSDDNTLKYDVRWDGCVHIYSDDDDYLHIYDLDAFIEQLQLIQQKAKERFPDEY